MSRAADRAAAADDAVERMLALEPRRLNIAELAAREAEEPKFVIPGWLPERQVTLFSAHGSGGKSQIALHVAVCLCLGLPFMGVAPSRRCRVLYFSCEDDLEVLHFRLQQICRSLGVAMGDLEGWLMLEDATESDNVMYTEAMDPAQRLTHTYTRTSLVMDNEKFDVLIIDNASDVYAANEIARAPVKHFISKLKKLARRGAVLLLGHVNKEAAKSPASGQMYSGSTAWHNSVRSRWELAKANDGENDDVPRVLTCVKSNYGPEGHSHRWVWNHKWKVFSPEEERSPLEKRVLADRERIEVLLSVREVAEVFREPVRRAERGSANTRSILEQSKHFPRRLRLAPVGETLTLLDRYASEGFLAYEEIRVDRKVKAVFALTEKGRSSCAS